MTVLRNDNRWDRSNVLFQKRRADRIRQAFPARRYAAYRLRRIGFFQRRALRLTRESKVIDLADICRDLSMSGQLAAFEVSERFYEIGSPQGIADTEEYLVASIGQRMNYTQKHLREAAAILQMLDVAAIERWSSCWRR